MISAVLLLFCGLVLIFFEFFLPGGILGTAGALTVVLSVILFANESHSILYTLLFAIAAAFLVGFLIHWTLKRLRESGANKTIYLESDQEGFRAVGIDESLIGEEGVASSDLRPSGFAKVSGKHCPVVAESGYVARGSKVKIIGGRSGYYIVKEV